MARAERLRKQKPPWRGKLHVSNLIVKGHDTRDGSRGEFIWILLRASKESDPVKRT